MSSPTCTSPADAGRCPRFHTCSAAACPLEEIMGINVSHQPAAAAYAPLALNSGVGQLLERYANFLQPERLQQRGFQNQAVQQGLGGQIDYVLGQQRAQNAAAES